MDERPKALLGEWVSTPVHDPGMVLIAAIELTTDEINSMHHAERDMYSLAALRCNELGLDGVRVDKIKLCQRRRSVRDGDRIEFYQYRGSLA